MSLARLYIGLGLSIRLPLLFLILLLLLLLLLLQQPASHLFRIHSCALFILPMSVGVLTVVVGMHDAKGNTATWATLSRRALTANTKLTSLEVRTLCSMSVQAISTNNDVTCVAPTIRRQVAERTAIVSAKHSLFFLVLFLNRTVVLKRRPT